MRLTDLLESDDEPDPAHERQADAIDDIRKRKKQEEGQRDKEKQAAARRQQAARDREAEVDQARALASQAFWRAEAERHKAEAKKES